MPREGQTYYIGKKQYTNAQKVWALDFFAPYYYDICVKRKTRSPFRDAFMILKEQFERRWDETIQYRTFYDWHYNEPVVRSVQRLIADGDRSETQHEQMLMIRQNEQRIAILRMQDEMADSLWVDR